MEELRTVYLDCEQMRERKQAHLYLQEKLAFPDYYGHNLDALYDCLQELPPCSIVVENVPSVPEAEDIPGSYALQVLDVFHEAVWDGAAFTLAEIDA